MGTDSLLPEADGFIEPSLRTCTDPETEPVTQVTVAMELHVRAQFAERLDPPLHHRWRGNAVALTDDDKSRRFAGGVVRMSGVGHHHSRRLRKSIVSSEPRNTMRADGGGHSRASRTPP
jgi:hypothetical protein